MLIKLSGNTMFLNKTKEQKDEFKKELKKKTMIYINEFDESFLKQELDKHLQKKKKKHKNIIFCIDNVENYSEKELLSIFGILNGFFSILLFNNGPVSDFLSENVKHIYF